MCDDDGQNCETSHHDGEQDRLAQTKCCEFGCAKCPYNTTEISQPNKNFRQVEGSDGEGSSEKRAGSYLSSKNMLGPQFSRQVSFCFTLQLT